MQFPLQLIILPFPAKPCARKFCGCTLNAQLVIRMVEACAINLFILTLQIRFWTTKIMNQDILSPSEQHKSASIIQRIRESQHRRIILNI